MSSKPMNPKTKHLTDAQLEKVAHDFMNDPACAHIREDEKWWDSFVNEGLDSCESELKKYTEAKRWFNVIAYAGIGKGVWGSTSDDVNKHINDLRE